MAKKKEDASMYVNAREQIRKAKGNPNKNVHAKKNGSNYGGYTENTAPKKVADTSRSSRRVKMPKNWRIALIVSLVAMMVLIILRMTPLKENLILGYSTTLMLGLFCGGLFCYRKIYRKAEDRDTAFNIIQVILFLVAAFYILMSVMGFLKLLGIAP